MSFPDIDYRDFCQSVIKGNEHILDQDAMAFLNAVQKSAKNWAEVLGPGIRLFRAQRGCDWPQDPEDPNPMARCYSEDRMKPAPEKIGPGRANVSRKPVFYAATSELVAIKETRPWIGSLISVGCFETVRSLRIINLVDAYLGERSSFLFSLNKVLQKQPQKDAETVAWHFIGEAFCKPVTLDDDAKGYLPTQILAELFKAAAFDGIAFRSSVAGGCSADNGDDDNSLGYNIVLFNLDSVTQVGGHVVKKTGFCIATDPGPHY